MRPAHERDCPHYDGLMALACTCVDREDEMVEDFQAAQPYVRTPRVPQSAPQGPYQSLASLIRNARRDGLLKPVQQYGGGHVPASVP